jgi:hypothetical protein
MATQQKFTNLQQELLDIFSLNVSEDDLKEIKVMLHNYLSAKKQYSSDHLWELRGWTDKAAESWDGE